MLGSCHTLWPTLLQVVPTFMSGSCLIPAANTTPSGTHIDIRDRGFCYVPSKYGFPNELRTHYYAVQSFAVFRVLMQGRLHVRPWLIESSGVPLSCFSIDFSPRMYHSWNRKIRSRHCSSQFFIQFQVSRKREFTWSSFSDLWYWEIYRCWFVCDSHDLLNYLDTDDEVVRMLIVCSFVCFSSRTVCWTYEWRQYESKWQCPHLSSQSVFIYQGQFSLLLGIENKR